jgi:M6 family metalloprotease-like protein
MLLTVLTRAALAVTMMVVFVPTASSHQAAPPADCRLPAPAGVGNEHEGPTDYQRWLPPHGALRAVVLFVEFPDAKSTATERAERINLLNPAPSWLATSSYGRTSLTLTFDTDWRQLPQPHTAYSQYNSSFLAHRNYLQDAVTAADTAVDFSQYQLVYVVPARAAVNLPTSPAFIATSGWGVSADGVELRHGVTFGQDLDFWGYKLLTHETGHVFGLPDLYSYAGGPNIHAAAGGWDVMGLISGPAPDHLAWHKWKMAWLDDTQIACQTSNGQLTSTLTPIGNPSGTKASVVRVGPQRAVVVENRTAGRLDVNSPCLRPGVLVYVVDGSVGGGSNPVTVADRTPGSAVPGCDAAHAHLDNAALTAIGHEIVVSGVRVRLTATSGTSRTVRVSW